MAQGPSSEDSARKILDIFVQYFKSKAGSVLQGNNFMAVKHNYGLSASDFNAGLQFALDKGWVELPDQNSYRLTQAGFDEA